jgi:ferritin
MAMISESLQKAINKQINEELYSAYMYAALAAWFEENNLKGCANWMRAQSDEELGHARKFVDYMHDRGGIVKFDTINAPKAVVESPLEAFKASYDHECHISKCINELAIMAMKEEDHASHAFLNWFVQEQVEEEATVDEIVNQLKLVDGAPGGLFLIDRELSQRTEASSSAE